MFHESIVKYLDPSTWINGGALRFMPQPTNGGLPPIASGGGNGDYWGSGPGFDIGDIPDFLRWLGGGAPGQVPAPNGTLLQPPEIGPGPEVLPTYDPSGREAFQNGGYGVTIRRGLYIGGTAPGFWHTTPVRTVYDRDTGQPRQVGGNRYANRITLAQDDSGALQHFAPVEPTGWKFKYKARAARHHHHRRKAKHHHHRRRKATTHHHHRQKQIAAPRHHHHLTQKQLRAGFGGRARM